MSARARATMASTTATPCRACKRSIELRGQTPVSVDPLDVVAWAGLQHALDQLLRHRRRLRVRDGDHPRLRRFLVPIEVPCPARDEDGLAAATALVTSCAVNVMVPSMIVKSSSSARWRCGGGPPPAPTRQSSANIDPPDSSPVTRNVYMSPGPHQERPASPAVVWTTRPSILRILPQVVLGRAPR